MKFKKGSILYSMPLSIPDRSYFFSTSSGTKKFLLSWSYNFGEGSAIGDYIGFQDKFSLITDIFVE